jgi:hypothetical protein
VEKTFPSLAISNIFASASLSAKLLKSLSAEPVEALQAAPFAK